MKFNIFENLSAFILGFLIVFSLVPWIIKLANKINFVDKPDQRKVHIKVTPLMGGVAVFFGFITIIAYSIFTSHIFVLDRRLIGFILSATIITLIGVVDDKFGMTPLVKMIGQIIGCTIFIYSYELYNILGPIYITLPILYLWMIGLINALNFLDNMDGIISGMASIIAIGFFAMILIINANIGYHSNDMNTLLNLLGLLCVSFAGSLLGFLPYNFNPAKIFLGDAGSMFIGFFLSTIGILVGRISVIQTQSKFYYLIPVMLLSFAIFDISLVSITRKRDGRRVSQGGKDHSTHRIRTAMDSPKITALIVYLINLIIIITTIIIFKMHSVVLLLIAVLMYLVAFLYFGKKLDQIPIEVTKNQLK